MNPRLCLSRINGVLDQTYTNAGAVDTAGTNSLKIGGVDYSSSEYSNSYIDDLRVTKGVGRYTENFSIPTAALPDQ